jgi:acyl-CoA thioesterase I
MRFSDRLQDERRDIAVKTELRRGMKILFQGDSITDCGRLESPLRPMGTGYASIVYHWLIARFPQLDLKFFNRGISGNRTRDLVSRWDRDCLDMKPDMLSILVGVNDTWRRYDKNDPTGIEEFERNYDTLLNRARSSLNPMLVVCEPFILPHPPEVEAMREDLDPKIQVVRELAKKYDAIFVPFDGIFGAASINVPPSHWTIDGVHPTDAGHALMAQVWMEYVLGEVP